MADDTRLNAGTAGDLIATDELTTLNGAAATAGLKVQRVKLGFGTDNVLRDVDAANGLPVVGTFFQATQPVSGPVTDAQLRAAAVSVAGTRPNSGTANVAGSQHLTVGGSDGTNLRPILLDTAGRVNVNTVLAAETTKVIGTVNISAAQTIAVTGTFFQATQPVSLATNTPILAAGAAVIGALVANQSVNTAQIAGVAAAAGAGVVTAGTQRMVLASDVISPPVGEQRAGTLGITATALVNTGATATLPAPAAGLFHYITSIQLVKLYAALGVASGAGVVVTSTNLPGGLAWTTEQIAAAIGTANTVINYQPTTPLKSAAAAVATTLVAPAQLQTIWRWNISYTTAA